VARSVAIRAIGWCARRPAVAADAAVDCRARVVGDARRRTLICVACCSPSPVPNCASTRQGRRGPHRRKARCLPRRVLVSGLARPVTTGQFRVVSCRRAAMASDADGSADGPTYGRARRVVSRTLARPTEDSTRDAQRRVQSERESSSGDRRDRESSAHRFARRTSSHTTYVRVCDPAVAAQAVDSRLRRAASRVATRRRSTSS